VTPERIDEFWSRVEDLPDAGIKAELLGLVREAVAAEREACAGVCDELPERHRWQGGREMKAAAYDCAAAIRARKES
jgi:hypothetical protein